MFGLRICMSSLGRNFKRYESRLLQSRYLSKLSDVTFNVTPKTGLVDDPFAVEIAGLEPFQFVTLHSKLRNNNDRFGAVSDRNGAVSTKAQPSVGGNYIGTESEGLLWSMKALPGQENVRRLIKLDILSPHVVDVALFHDHLSIEDVIDSNPISSSSVERWYKSQDVERIEVKDGRVRGMLFMPKGKGPFLPVIDMFGSIGKIIEFRAALLASRGFAVLSLPYFGYDDLPPKLTEIDLDYFEDAVEFMMKLRKVESKGVGVYGVSKGGEICHLMAEFLPDVKAVVSIGGTACLFDHPLRSKRRNIFREASSYAGRAWENVPLSKDGEFCLRNSVTLDQVKDMMESYGTKTEKASANFLFIHGEGDMCLNPMWAVLSAKRLEDHGKKNYELLLYPGAGHLIEPPFAPLAKSSFVRTYNNVIFNYGGETSLHAKAQLHSWQKIQLFFRQHLSL